MCSYETNTLYQYNLPALACSTFTSCARYFFLSSSSILLCWRMLVVLYSALSSPRQSSSYWTYTHIYKFNHPKATDRRRKRREKKKNEWGNRGLRVLPGPSLSILRLSLSLACSYTTQGAVIVVAPIETYLLSSLHFFGFFPRISSLPRLIVDHPYSQTQCFENEWWQRQRQLHQLLYHHPFHHLILNYLNFWHVIIIILINNQVPKNFFNMHSISTIHHQIP